MSANFISPVLSISVNFHTWVPEPMSSPRNLPFSIGPPDTPIVGRSHDAAPISSDGVVLSQPISSTTPSKGFARIDSSTSIAAWLRNSIVVGRISVSPRLITGNSIGKAARVEHAVAHVLRELAEMRVAGRRLRPGVADADDRPAVELVVRDALVLHPRPVDERVAVVAAEPDGGAELAFLPGHLAIHVDRDTGRGRFTRRALPALSGRIGGRARDRRRASSCRPGSPPAVHACAGSPARRRPGSRTRFRPRWARRR